MEFCRKLPFLCAFASLKTMPWKGLSFAFLVRQRTDDIFVKCNPFFSLYFFGFAGNVLLY